MTAPSLLDVPATTHMTHATHMTHMTNLDHAEHSTHSDPLEELIAVLREAPDLTAEERRLLGLLLSGLTTVEVADVLHVSERTVRTYRAAMVERLRQRVCEVAA